MTEISIQTMDGRYRLDGLSLELMAKRWHAEHPQGTDDRFYTARSPSCARCLRANHRECSGYVTVACGCDNIIHRR